MVMVSAVAEEEDVYSSISGSDESEEEDESGSGTEESGWYQI